MGSARRGLLDIENQGDVFAELFTQELLTKGGIKFNLNGFELSTEELAKFDAIKQQAKNVAKNIIKKSRGKLLVTRVA